MTTDSLAPPREVLEQVVHGRMTDPHAVLGPHPSNGGTKVVRTLQPNAESVAVLVGEGRDATRVEAQEIHGGVFAAEIDGDSPYQFEARYPSGDVYVYEDPYRFPPTLGELDLYLAGEGRHHDLWRRLGSRATEVDGVAGTAFAVWAPNAASVRVVGGFNFWDGRTLPMRSLGSSGVWELFVPRVEAGAHYKYEILTHSGDLLLKADPMAQSTEMPPATASVVAAPPRHEWQDAEWLEQRATSTPQRSPMSVYEVHLGSWRRVPEEGNRSLSYRELARELPEYVASLGFTHVELLPVAEHPFYGSWGYQVSSYFAPTARYGSPDDLRALIDACHQAGLGVILDWVPAHFPRDDFALARFDGTALYEHEDPRQGAHPDWGTLVFNVGRNEVRNFLLANALYWLEEFHVDGLRVDAVASMLYLDYSRKSGEWVPNRYGGRENLESIDFFRELNEVVHLNQPGVLMVAEESTAWPGVSRPTYLGGLGFGFKWNMGWMHDTLQYFSRDPIHRRWHHHELTFGLLYAFSENFILPLSHDEVVHGKGSLVNKMGGDWWQKFANLRALYGWMWAHPGKQLLFMGCEVAQHSEWNHDGSVDWHLLEQPEHGGVQRLVSDLNAAYRDEPALWDADADDECFFWIEPEGSDHNVYVFGRWSQDRSRVVVCVANLSPVPRYDWPVGLPHPGRWREVLNTDAAEYGGSGVGNQGAVEAHHQPWHNQPYSTRMTLPPLGVVWLRPDGLAPVS